ncbi:MAG: glycosyltransferase family 4 protein [Asgard group archaeon]|nr:glycosyltransferase family 4 protein [Asgard group archaeon]
MAKILMITHGPMPDNRIDREAKALKEAGHKIYIIYSKKKRNLLDYYEKKILLPFNNRTKALLPFAVRITAKKVKKILDVMQPDFIHAHDIAAANVARLVVDKDLKFIYDDHEIWEYLRKRQAQMIKNPLYKLIIKIVLFQTKRINKKIANKADLIIVVNKHWIDYYKERNIESNKIIVIENFYSKELIDKVLSSDIKIDDFFIKDPRKKVIHTEKNVLISSKVVRDVTNFVYAISELDDWVLCVFGPNDEKSEQLGVKFFPPTEQLEYLASCSKCDVALNPLVLNRPRGPYSSQNRLFEFAALGLVIISSKAITLVEKFDDKIIWLNPDASIEEIKRILTQTERHPKKEEIQEVAKQYTWKKEIKKLIKVYENLEKS